MKAMQYEFLIRQVYECGRNYAVGADADIYRNMQHAHNDLTNDGTLKSLNEREYEFRSAFAAVRGHVEKALVRGLAKIKYSASESDIQALEKSKAALTFKFYDVDKLDAIIEAAFSIFNKYGMTA